MAGLIAMRLLNVFLLLLLMGCDSSSQPSRVTLATVPANGEWLACTADSMCSAIWLSCHGWLAIGSSYESDVQGWYRTENSDFLSKAECDGAPLSRPSAACHGGTCKLR